MNYESKFSSIIKQRDDYINWENGEIRTVNGLLIGYVDFSNNEQSIIYRNSYGTIDHIDISGDTSKYIDYDKYEEFKSWRYWENETK